MSRTFAMPNANSQNSQEQAPYTYRQAGSTLSKVMFGFTAFAAIIGCATGVTTVIGGIAWYVPVGISLGITAIVVPLYVIFSTKGNEEEELEKQLKSDNKEKNDKKQQI